MYNNEQVWDGQIDPYSEWNQNLATVLSRSVNWYFKNNDREVGRKQLQDYFHKIKYGNADLSGNLDSYWIESSLKISPIEQVQIRRKKAAEIAKQILHHKKIYNNQLQKGIPYLFRTFFDNNTTNVVFNSFQNERADTF